MNLVRAWNPTETQLVQSTLVKAIRNSNLIGAQMQAAASNQAQGNSAVKLFLGHVHGQLVAPDEIDIAPGKGYPDCYLKVGGVSYCLEVKNTENWTPNDTNRRVLLSSTKKMRKLVSTATIDDPPAHLCCTLVHDQYLVINEVRLDFIEPTTEVNVRLEASTSQKLLTNATHYVVTIP
ncbi:hypothetical protein [Stagnihabitans tardus]|uniref:Uncharacterized protein n=1 Tax=Stagnihabitans tardus TaxID=2699202 RepID=A0AAE4YA84_9RHOB|nr:hypothetical protein [Stagnihabitans tardus]NBZ86579.1 hypothetical protein [Stagnihabitans tardus]